MIRYYLVTNKEKKFRLLIDLNSDQINEQYLNYKIKTEKDFDDFIKNHFNIFHKPEQGYVTKQLTKEEFIKEQNKK